MRTHIIEDGKSTLLEPVTNGAGQNNSSGYNHNTSNMYQSSIVGYNAASSNNGFIGKYQAEHND